MVIQPDALKSTSASPLTLLSADALAAMDDTRCSPSIFDPLDYTSTVRAPNTVNGSSATAQRDWQDFYILGTRWDDSDVPNMLAALSIARSSTASEYQRVIDPPLAVCCITFLLHFHRHFLHRVDLLHIRLVNYHFHLSQRATEQTKLVTSVCVQQYGKNHDGALTNIRSLE
ncbi:hypothetical protein BGX33_000705 [Mortierella sp. NVP41]|nr:hypothetical protein BGX33_000705 [Mortierella sp. NVP41]